MATGICFGSSGTRLTKVLKTYMDGIERLSVTIDLVGTVFNNDPQVFWGFTASTGGARNLQRFCTALNPAIKSLTNQETCFGRAHYLY